MFQGPSARASRDLGSEWTENWLELMAKDMRTQPTSQNSIPTSQNLDFEY